MISTLFKLFLHIILDFVAENFLYIFEDFHSKKTIIRVIFNNLLYEFSVFLIDYKISLIFEQNTAKKKRYTTVKLNYFTIVVK